MVLSLWPEGTSIFELCKVIDCEHKKVLEGYGNISRKQAEKNALSEYEKFNKTQRIESDFDRETKAFLKAQGNKGRGGE